MALHAQVFNLGIRNKIINGDFFICQRGISFSSALNNDGAYTLDRWKILSDGNDVIDVTQSTTAPDKTNYSIALDVETADKKFGICQIIESKNISKLKGSCNLSFDAKVSSITSLDNIKAAVIYWTGTADSPTSDPISAWGNENVNPTLVTNWNYANTPVNLGVTTEFDRYDILASVPSSATNVAVIIWSDVTSTTVGHFLYISNVQLEEGATATLFENRPIGMELQLCLRYFERVYFEHVLGHYANVTYADCYIFPKRISGCSFLNQVTSAGARYAQGYNGSVWVWNDVTAISNGSIVGSLNNILRFSVSVIGSPTNYGPMILVMNSSRIDVDAEL